jgi:hypothetical protein
MGLYFTFREKLRSNPTLNKTLYLTQSLYRSHFGRLVGDIRRARKAAHLAQGVALCLRFRDEARYLAEWLEYYQAAGVSHFFLYNNFSADDYRSVLEPWLNAGHVTLVDWPKVPASPAAEEDCIRRALGRFRWVGFLDADEFVVIRDGSSIGDFLDRFPSAPGVGLHWRYFGSSMHRLRPPAPVIVAYQNRAPFPNRHIKSFVRPERAAQCRNSHSWFYSPIGIARGEQGNPLYGSLYLSPTAHDAWINHYYCKSEEDYLEKAARRSTLDKVGINFQTRRPERLDDHMRSNNEILDPCAVDYYLARCRALGRAPVLLEQTPLRHSTG